MSVVLRIESLVFTIIMFIIVFELTRKEKVNIKYSLVWFFPIILFCFFIIFPRLSLKIANLLCFKTLSNFIFSILLVFLIFINLSLTVIVSRQKNYIKTIIQEVSLLKSTKKKENEK